MGVIFALSSVRGLTSPLEPTYDFILRKFAHMAEYAVLTLFLYRALRAHDMPVKQALLAGALAAFIFAVSDEWHQTFVKGRNGTLRDVAIDGAGIAGAAWIVRWRRLRAYPKTTAADQQ